MSAGARHAVVLVVVLAAAALSAWLLWRVAGAADDIEERSSAIVESARPINANTEAVRQLERTNELARSILDSAKPLDKELAAIVELSTDINTSAVRIERSASRIDAVVADINTTVGAINESAGAIDTTAAGIERSASGIEGEVASILNVARQIDADVRLINTHLDDSIRVGAAIEEDTDDILIHARAGHQTTACIDTKVPDSNGEGDDLHCQELMEAEERAERERREGDPKPRDEAEAG